MLYCRKRISVPMFDIASGIQISGIRHPDIWYPNITYQISGVGIKESESRSRYPGVGIQVSGVKMLIFHWQYVVFRDFSKKKKKCLWCGNRAFFENKTPVAAERWCALPLNCSHSITFFEKCGFPKVLTTFFVNGEAT